MQRRKDVDAAFGKYGWQRKCHRTSVLRDYNATYTHNDSMQELLCSRKLATAGKYWNANQIT